jgi:hypothetical protein
MRAAMVGGGAYVAGKHTQRRQEQESGQEARIEQLEQQQAAPAPPAATPAAAPATDVVEQLTKLKGLLDAGVLTQDEFEGQKRKLLQGA